MPKISSKIAKFDTNFLNFVVFVFLLDVCVVTLCGVSFGFLPKLLFYLMILILSIGLGFEIFLWICKVPVLPLMTGILVFSKPSRTHLEIVSVALEEMTMLKKGKAFMEDENKRAMAVVISEVKNRLASGGIVEKSETEWLIATALGKKRNEIRLIPFVSEKEYQDILKMADRRAKGESLDNIFGFTEFFGLRFDVNKKVLTPRMETELLVEEVLKRQKNIKNCKILDLGTGSGAIAIALAKNCDATITAVDVSKAALATATANAQNLGADVEFLQSDLFDGLKRKRKFDIIVSNPPYIPTSEIEKLDKNVRECDPTLALDGGDDGLDFYRQIIPQSTSRLCEDGQILFEVGKGQARFVKNLLKENGFEEIKIIKDYNKIERIVCGKLR